jgi:hypothetical protein
MILGIIAESELASLGRVEECFGLCDVCVRDQDFDCAEAVDRETVRMSQRFATHHRRNAGGLQECADLVRMNLTIRNEHALMLLTHGALRDDLAGGTRLYRKQSVV